MSDVKQTKNELRAQQKRLSQLDRYLPTLQLKKAMLQTEANEARAEILRLEDAFHEVRLNVSQSCSLLTERIGLKMEDAANISRIEKHYENIAGVEIPIFEGVTFTAFDYPLFSTPAWLDALVQDLREMASAKAKVMIAEEKKEAIEKELREVSIRVNLFEKNLMPRAKKNIRKIKVFLGDQELAAVGQAKVAKSKIEKKKRLHAG